MRVRIVKRKVTSLSSEEPDAGLALVLAAADMNPVVATVGGLHDELVEIGVGLEP